MPSKLYGIMASGRPAIAIMSEDSEVAMTIKEFKCGVVLPPKDVDALIGAITSLKADDELRKTMGANAYEAFIKYFTVEHCAEKYYRLINKAASPKKRYLVGKRMAKIVL